MKVGGVLVVVVAALAWVASASASPAAFHPPRVKGQTNSTSSNWAGYAASSGRERGVFTSVSADWKVPTVSCAEGENSYSSFWVGLDGYSSSSVEQIGTDSDCANGVAKYYAWYEMYPHPPVTFAEVSHGDSIHASVVAGAAKGAFELMLSDGSSQLGDFSETFRGAKLSSAEAIAEAPSYNPGPFGAAQLTDFTSVGFSNVRVNGDPIGDYDPDGITMERGGTVLASISPLSSDGTSFTVWWGQHP